MLDRDGGPALGNAVERFDLIEPLALRDALLEIETRGGGLRVAPRPSLDSTGIAQNTRVRRT